MSAINLLEKLIEDPKVLKIKIRVKDIAGNELAKLSELVNSPVIKSFSIKRSGSGMIMLGEKK